MSSRRKKAESSDASCDLRLYVACQTPKSILAIANLKKFCEEHLNDRYRIEVIDVARNPKIARRDEIVAIPTLGEKAAGSRA